MDWEGNPRYSRSIEYTYSVICFCQIVQYNIIIFRNTQDIGNELAHYNLKKKEKSIFRPQMVLFDI